MNPRSQNELRQPNKQTASALKKVINGMQGETLRSVEQFGWFLQFLRPSVNGEVLAVVRDPDSRSFAVIEPDGTLVKNPALRFR